MRSMVSIVGTIVDSIRGARLSARTSEEERSWQWILTDILLPFLVTRLALFMTGWFAQYFAPAASRWSRRGWMFTPVRLFDMWARWDTEWYFSIIKGGYSVRGPLDKFYSNIAFYPLYPTLIKMFGKLVPNGLQDTELLLLIGILLSMIFLIGALVLLYKLIMDMGKEREVARRTVLYLLVFPAAFFFTAVYTESILLFFSVAVFYFAWHRNWLMAGIMGFFMALSRPVGLFALPAVGWMYMESIEWKFKRIRFDVLWLGLIPAGLLTFLAVTYSVSGDFLAPFHVQAAWGRTFTWPWQTLFHPNNVDAYITQLDWLSTVSFILLGVAALFVLPSKGFGIYTILLYFPVVTSGTLLSATRFSAVAFPAFILMALAGRRRWLDQMIVFLFFALQILLMAAWSQFYWVG